MNCFEMFITAMLCYKFFVTVLARKCLILIMNISWFRTSTTVMAFETLHNSRLKLEKFCNRKKNQRAEFFSYIKIHFKNVLLFFFFRFQPTYCIFGNNFCHNNYKYILDVLLKYVPSNDFDKKSFGHKKCNASPDVEF